MEGGIIYGLTAALYGDLNLESGAVKESNFHDYRMLRMNESPDIEVIIVDSGTEPTGVGEPGLPPIAPAWPTRFIKPQASACVHCLCGWCSVHLSVGCPVNFEAIVTW
jgi:hypothetical protein